MIEIGTEVIVNNPRTEPFIGIVIDKNKTSSGRNTYVVTNLRTQVNYWFFEEHLVVVR